LGIGEISKSDLRLVKIFFSYNLMKEENEEYLEVVNNNDLVEM
jgi:hypothetical protein